MGKAGLRGANLRSVNVSRAQLYEANFDGADMRRAAAYLANFTGARSSAWTCPTPTWPARHDQGPHARLRPCRAFLLGTFLNGTDLEHRDLSRRICSGQHGGAPTYGTRAWSDRPDRGEHDQCPPGGRGPLRREPDRGDPLSVQNRPLRPAARAAAAAIASENRPGGDVGQELEMQSVTEPEFRNALARWGGGVTVVTARAGDEPWDDRRLVLIGFAGAPRSSSRASPTAPTRTTAWSRPPGSRSHVLGSEQGRCRRRSPPRAGEVRRLPERAGALRRPAAALRRRAPRVRPPRRPAGGDHTILVGRVVATELAGSDPLVYCNRAYDRLSGTT